MKTIEAMLGGITMLLTHISLAWVAMGLYGKLFGFEEAMKLLGAK